MRHATDTELLSRYYGNRDEDALGEFVSRHRQWALRQARRYTGRDFEDIVQTSILRLMDAKPIAKSVNNPLGWWNNMIASSAIDHIRAETSRRQRELLFVQSYIGEAGIDERTGSSNQVAAQVRERLRTLDGKFSDPLIHRYFRGLTYHEIAATMGLNVSTVSTRISRGLELLRTAIAPEMLRPSVDDKITGDRKMANQMNQPNDTQESFVPTSNDRWVVYMEDYRNGPLRGIGRIVVKNEYDEGTTKFVMTMDIAPANTFPTGYPEKSDDVITSRMSINLLNPDDLQWDSFESHLIPGGRLHRSGARQVRVDVKNQSNHLIIRDNEDEHRIELVAGNHILPQEFLHLFVTAQDPANKEPFPVSVFGFDLIDGRREWSASDYTAQYVGRKGAPTGLNNTYEIEYPNRVISVWTDENHQFIGSSDERECLLTFENEGTARQFLSL